MAGIDHSSWRSDLAIIVAAFVVTSAIAAVLGAANFGTALSFGQIGFAVAVVAIMLRR
ncbi:MAG TPA: hypothetical protein VFB41_09900 [Solirubrobacteraceae bacterium]|nr:hypothetical protein [Solirubrobacteraceae bacterium]